MDFIGLNIEETFKKLNSSIKGLSSEEAIKRIKKYGLNIFYFNSEFLKLFLIHLFNPIILLLFVTFIFASINNNYFNMIIIIILILINIISNIILEYRNQYPINFEKLRLKKVIVIRNGKKMKINSKNITIGDIVVIAKHNYIKADMKIIVGNDIEIVSPLNNESNEILLAGDFIKNGSGMGIVYGVGKNTEIYKLAQKTSQKRKQKLPFTLFINKLNIKICLFSVITTIISLSILYLRNITTNYLELLVIGSIPIFLNIILVITLYYFKNHNKNIDINNLNLLGSIKDITTFIFSKDSLTLNEITAKIIELKDGSIYEVDGVGYNDFGQVIPINASAKYKDSLYNLNLIGKLSYLNNKASLTCEEGIWNAKGNPYDLALLTLNQKINHFNFENQIISEITNENYSIIFYKENETTRVSIKGNIKEILKFCDTQNEEIISRCSYLESLGYKVIAFCDGIIKNKKKYTEKDVKNLNFIGLIGLINPLKETSKASIEMLQKENINIIINSNDNENNTEILGKQLNIINKKNQIANNEDVIHNFNLGERNFNNFVKETKMFSNINNDNLIKIVNSLKRQGEIVGIVSNNIEDIEIIKQSHISLTTNNSVIKSACDLIYNDNLESVANFINQHRNIKSIISNIINYLICCNITKLLFVILSTIFASINLSINTILIIDLISSIFALGLLFRNNNANNLEFIQPTKSSKKEAFKWILGSVFNGFLSFIFILILNKMNLEINYEYIFILALLNIIFLFYYYNQNNSIFKMNFKENLKLYLFIIIFLIQLILFKFVFEINNLAVLISISISLIPIFITETRTKFKNKF